MEDYKKKYEDALNAARKFKNDCPSLWDTESNPFKGVFEELEDDNIGNRLLNWFKGCSWNTVDNGTLKRDDIIAWLEKQGELKPIFRVGDYIRNKKTKDRVLIEQIDIANKIYCYVSRDDAAEIHSDFRFSEQNDWEIIGQKIVGQKPTEWSEEDEKERKRVVGLLEGWLSTFNETSYAEDCKCGISWLNSLKQRMKGE